MKDNELLFDLYYNKHNYDGINQLFNKAKQLHPTISKDAVRDWLNEQKPYQQTKTKVGKKEHLPIYSEVPYSFQIDLTFFPRYTSKNDGYNMLFTAININTRFAYGFYGKDKTMDTIIGFIERLLRQTKINSITCDEGTEFKNNKFIAFCNDNNIILYFVKGDSHKLGIINRFHRTIKEKLTKYFIASNSVRWIDVIDEIIYNYNHTINRGIGLEPVKVNNAIETDIIDEKRYATSNFKDEPPETFEVGDIVLITRKKKLFEDKQLAKFSNIAYRVAKVLTGSLEVEDSEGNIFRVKIDEVQKIKDNGEYIPDANNVMEAVNKEYKTHRKLKKEGIDESNIVNEPRRRRQDVVYV
jgi:hypothetical protein